MPVIVIGADTPIGRAVVEGFDPHRREVRAFVTDPAAGAALKERGYKVAIGDLSDDTHVGGASRRAFSAVLIADAATDDRERSFASGRTEVVGAWARALAEAGVRRIIWVEPGATEPPQALSGAADEIAVVGDRDRDEAVSNVVRLDGAGTLP